MLGRDPLLPPRRLLRYGRADFADTGEAWLGHLLDLGGLRPDHRVLELWSGPGRLARPLVRYLERGSYDGIDPDRRLVGWCRRAYRSRPGARFLQADVFHPRLHPGGAHTVAEYRLPYEDESFDLVVAVEVLPHLLEADADRTLREAARVLAPGGRLVASAFVLDDASRAAIAAGDATFAFLDAGGHVAVVSDHAPEEAVAYDRSWLEARAPGPVEVQPGSWRGDADPSARELLDVMVAARA